MEAIPLLNGKIYFVSDLHLGVPDHASSLEREKRFVRWLDEVSREAHAIFVLGVVEHRARGRSASGRIPNARLSAGPIVQSPIIRSDWRPVTMKPTLLSVPRGPIASATSGEMCTCSVMLIVKVTVRYSALPLSSAVRRVRPQVWSASAVVLSRAAQP